MVLSQILQRYQPYLPFVVICAIALSVIALFLVFIAGRRLMARSARRAALMPPPGIKPLHTSEPSSLSFFKKTWAKLFNRKPDQPHPKLSSQEASLEASFKRALKVFRSFLYGRESQYTQPWYVLIGAEGTGKTSLLEDLDLPLPLGRPNASMSSEENVTWWYFDRGVVLDVRGDFILQKNSAHSREGAWENFLKYLNKERPYRPLDGIILTLSAAELIGPHRLNAEEIKERAQLIYGKLWKTQRLLGMKIPVYVLVTKTDLVPGFSSFVSEIPMENTQEIFGWSSPYTLDTGFSSSWVNEIFSFLHQQLAKIRLGIFAHGKVDSERDGNMLFPAEFLELRENLGNYLCHLFQESSYHDSFFLRGVYFTGQADIEQVSPFTPTLLSNTSLETTLPSVETKEIPYMRKKNAFVRDLFEKKIFCESSLAVPIPKIINQRRKVIQTVKWAGASLAGIWGVGIYYNYEHLKQESRYLIPVLKTVHRSIKGLHERGSQSEDPALLGYLNTEANKILHAFVTLDNNTTWALFMPTSWFSPLDSYIQASFTAAYDRIILPALYAGLSHKGHQLVSLKGESIKKHSEGGFINPVLSSSFTQLANYVQALTTFEGFANRYNNLDKSRSIEDVAALVGYLFGQKLPQHFFNESEYYRVALAKALERNIDLSIYQVAASQKLGKLFKAFLDQTLNLQQGYPALELLQKNLLAFSDIVRARHLDDRDIRKTLDAAIAVADMMSSGELSWINAANFNPDPQYEALLSHIVALKLLGSDMARELMRVADMDFTRFKLTLSDFKSPLTGPFFLFQEDHLIGEPTPGLVSLIDSLSQFLDEPFMVPMDRYELTLKVPAGKALFWDEIPLSKAGALVDAYTHFSTQKLMDLPENFRPIFKVIARHTVRDKVTSLIAQAQTFHDIPSLFNGFNIREMTHSQVTNAANVTPYFSKLLGVFQEEGYVDNNAQVREILVDQNYDILGRIEKLLHLDNPYGAENEELVTRWNGEEMLGLALFGVHSIAEMKNYLTAQRNRISFLAKDLAEPILTIISLGYEGAMHKPKGLPLIDKWVQIIKDLQGYDTQTVTNPIKVLEDFLAYQLNELSIEDSCQFGDLEGDEFLADSDYFLSIRDKYYSMLKSRCELLAGHQSIQKFNQAALFFNQHLSQRYPFTSTAESPDGFEADPEDVQTFFELYDSLTASDRNLLERASQSLGAPRAVGDFIQQVDSIRPLLLASLDQGMKKHIAGIKVDVSFRTDRNREVGGNKIIDWSMNFGDHRIDARDPNFMGLWQAGSPIDVYLRWAADADTVPIPDPRHPQLSVSGQEAIFSYRGRWSLIKLIRTHATPDSTFDTRSNANPQTLEFFVPTAFSPACYQGNPPRLMDRKSEPARVYCQIALNLNESPTPDTTEKGKKPGKIIKQLPTKADRRLPVPRFPQEAPLVEALDLKTFKHKKMRTLRSLP